MEKVEKEKEKDAADLAAVAALAEQERQRKKREENKKKSNLELFKEELKRFERPIKKKQKSISTIHLLNKYLGYKSNAKRDRSDGKKKRVAPIKSPIPYMKKTWMNLRTRPITLELRRAVVACKRERSLLMSMTQQPLIYLLAI